jgi:two-component system response regulator YesN
VLAMEFPFFAVLFIFHCAALLSYQKQHGCIYCGEADNGLAGIELAFKVKPDLVITDIKMPGIDGISMAKKIKEKLPNCKFIIITGYDEFEYAKNAVKINAFDFLLKPIDEEEFISSIERAFTECSKAKENISIIRGKNLLDIMRGNISKREDIDKVLTDFQINRGNVLVANFLNNNLMIDGSSEAIRDTIEKYYKEDSYVVECHEGRMALIINEASILDWNSFDKTIRIIQKELYEKNKITVTVGVSDICNIYDLKEAYRESKEALNYRMYMKRGSIIKFSNIKKGKFIEIDKLIEIIRGIIIKLKACDKIGLNSELKRLYLDLFQKSDMGNYIMQQISVEIILRGIDVLNSFGISSHQIFGEDFNIYRNTSKLETFEEMHTFVGDILFKMLECIKEKEAQIYEDGMEDAIKYINGHFCDDISLSDVAKMVYLNESYLSRKLKKILGVSFKEYIIKLRMGKAMEYLMDPNIKITEIAKKIGYQNYRYFSQTFKKYTGYLPSRWREG